MSVRTFFDPHRVAQLRQKGISPQRQLPGGPAPASSSEARSSLELVEENARLRVEVRRLTDEVARLRGEMERLPSAEREAGLVKETDDDAVQRFRLLELDL